MWALRLCWMMSEKFTTAWWHGKTFDFLWAITIKLPAACWHSLQTKEDQGPWSWRSCQSFAKCQDCKQTVTRCSLDAAINNYMTLWLNIKNLLTLLKVSAVSFANVFRWDWGTQCSVKLKMWSVSRRSFICRCRAYSEPWTSSGGSKWLVLLFSVVFCTEWESSDSQSPVSTCLSVLENCFND